MVDFVFVSLSICESAFSSVLGLSLASVSFRFIRLSVPLSAPLFLVEKRLREGIPFLNTSSWFLVIRILPGRHSAILPGIYFSPCPSQFPVVFTTPHRRSLSGKHNPSRSSSLCRLSGRTSTCFYSSLSCRIDRQRRYPCQRGPSGRRP